MSKYKVMASEGSFGANQRKAPDKAQKILDAANKKIRGMEKAHNFEMQQREIYLRAQKFAQSQEEQSRENNYKLETDNRQQHINVVKQDYQNAITAARQMEQASRQQPEKLKGLLGLVPEMAKMYAQSVEQQDIESKKAASVAAYEHGFTMSTLENVLALNDQLTLSQFQATDYIQGLQEQGWSEDRINALYEYQYKTRGSKAWVDNIALAENSVNEFKYGLNAQLVENAALTPEQQIDQIKNYTQDFIGNISINGRPISAEVMSTIIAPKVRSAETRALNSLQQHRINARNQELTEEKNRVYSNTFKLNGSLGLHAINAMNPSKERRDEIINFIINGHRSGEINTDDLNKFYDSEFEIPSTGKTDTLAGHFIGDEKIGELNKYIQQVERFANDRNRNEEQELLRQTRSEITERINEYLATGETITPEFVQTLRELGKSKVGVKFQSDELDYVEEYYTKNAQMSEVSLEIGQELVDNGATLGELLEKGFSQSLLNRETDTGQSLLARAQVNEKAKTSTYFKEGNKSIKAYVDSHGTIEKNAFIEKKGLAYEVAYQQKQYRNLFFQILKRNGGDEIEADEQAQATIKSRIDEYLSDPKNSANGLIREQNDIKAILDEKKKFAIRQLEFTDLYATGANIGIVAQKIGKKLFMDSVQAMESNTIEIPADFRAIAGVFNKTPFEFAEYIAPAFGEDAPEFDATTLKTYQETFKPERMPLIRNPYGTSARIGRFKADARSLASRVRGQSIDYDGTPTESLRRTGDQYMSYMTDELGLSRNHALGLLANMYRESTFNASVPSGDDGGAGGLFQWYGNRQTPLVQKMVRSGNWKEQIKYALSEVGEPGQEFLQQDFANAQEAADWWMQYWERPAHPEKDSLKHTEILRHWN